MTEIIIRRYFERIVFALPLSRFYKRYCCRKTMMKSIREKASPNENEDPELP